MTFFGGDGAGTLVAERWVLTAAHTAANIPAGHRFAVAGVERQVTGAVAHPDGVDLALVELDAPAGVAPVARYEDDDEAGQEALLLGRSDCGNGVDGVDATWLRLRFDAPPDGSALEGDSSGPALLRAGAELRVAGVSSWQDHDGPLGTYGCIEHYARVSPHVTWIRSLVGPAG